MKAVACPAASRVPTKALLRNIVERVLVDAEILKSIVRMWPGCPAAYKKKSGERRKNDEAKANYC